VTSVEYQQKDKVQGVGSHVNGTKRSSGDDTASDETMGKEQVVGSGHSGHQKQSSDLHTYVIHAVVLDGLRGHICVA
jgi:hypothetical protein